MFANIIIFSVLFLVAIWTFQLQMLNFFYQSTNLDELDKTVLLITNSLEDEVAMNGITDSCASEYRSDVWVYKATKGKIDFSEPLVYSNGSDDEHAYVLAHDFAELYKKAVMNSGCYVAMVPTDELGSASFKMEILDDNFGSPDEYPIVSGNTDNLSAMHVSIIAKDLDTYVIIQRSSIALGGTLVQTLENQVFAISIVMIIVSLLLTFILSRVITKPIVRMNEAARSLAKGKYDVEFYGHGYLEIEELSDTLNFAARELSKNDRLQKDLISNVSHDLRTPLTMIKGYGEMMRDIPDENTPENLQVIVDETARLTELVNDMLDLSKIQSGARAPHIKCFCLTEMIRATLLRYEKLVMQDGYNIEFVTSTNAYVCADAGMILQVLYNLINNAVNYTGENKYVCIKQSLEGDTVRISITDTGRGVAKEDLPYIWNRYYKGDKVNRNSSVGTGLGLSIVKGILELHNATYGVEPGEGKGATFWFELKKVEVELETEKLIEL